MSKPDEILEYPLAPDRTSAGLSLQQTVRVLRQRWWLVLGVTALTTAGAWLMLRKSKDVYRATAVVRIDNTRQAMTGGLDPVVPENMSGLDVTASQAHVISSRAVIGEVVNQERLQPGAFQAPRLSRDRAIDEILKGLTATPRPRTTLIDINYADADSLRAQRIVNAIAQAFQAYHTRAAREAARHRREFIERQWVESESTLAAAQQRLSSFRNGQFDGSPDRLRAEQSGLPALDRQRDQLETARRVYAGALERIRQARGDQIDTELRTLLSTQDTTGGRLLGQLNSQLTQLRIDRERALAVGRAPTHPEVQRITAMLNATRASVADAVQTELSSLDLRLAAVRDQRERSVSTIRSLAGAETEETRLIQAVTVVSARAEALRAELNRARMAEAVDVGDAQILDLATAAVPELSRRTTQRIVIMVLFGFILGCIAALLLEVTNTSIRSRAEIEGLTTVPALGVIPAIGGSPARGGRLLRRFSQNGETPEPRGRLIAADFHTAAAEAYRILRGNLIYRSPENPLRSLVVTSAATEEGKSTTAANLAISFARQGINVLLVDCDLRRPNLHRIFGIESDAGLIDVLLGRATDTDVIRSTAFAGLFLMTRGNYDEQGAEMFDGVRAKRLITALCERYEIVIFDTPPVLATADATAVAVHTDGVLLVVRAGRTPREAAREALQRLQSVGAHVVGFILNDPDSVSRRYGEYTYAKEYYALQS
jgi:succinoglycan biosynthesis transport protein ExoP